MTLQVLQGNVKNSYLPLKQNYIFDGRQFNDDQMLKNHAKVFIDHNFNWKINSLDGTKIRVDTEEVETISLLPGLIFHLGQTGFKVCQRSFNMDKPWEDVATDFLSSFHWKNIDAQSFFFFLLPVQIRFLQGPQSGDIYTLSYGPRILGFNQLDLNIKDPTQPHEILKFEQIGDHILIKNVSGKNNVTINKQPLTQHTLTDKDQFAFGANVLEIYVLK